MISLGQHLDDRQRRGSVIHPAAVVANRPDGDVDVRIRQTGKIVRASRGNTGGTYTAGALVQVSRTDASGVTSNTGWVIIGPAPSAMRGSAKSSPLTDTTRRSAAVVTNIVPNPVVINAGETVIVTLYGVFPAGTSVSYGSAFLSDNVAPVVTPSQITLHVKADNSAESGDFDLLVDGVVVAPGLFEVLPPLLRSLWVYGYDVDFENTELVRIDARDMTVIRRYSLSSDSDPMDLDVKSGVLYAKHKVIFSKINVSDGEPIGDVACTHSSGPYRIVSNGTFFFYGSRSSSPPQLLMFNTADDSEGGWAVPTLGTTSVSGTWLDPSGAFIWVVADGPEVVKWDIAAAAPAATFVVSANPLEGFHGIAPYGDVVFGIFSDVTVGRILQKRDAGSFAILAAVNIADLGSARQLRIFAGRLYLLEKLTSFHSFLYEFDPDTLTMIRSVELPQTPFGESFILSNNVFYIGDDNGGVTRVDASTLTVIDHTDVMGEVDFLLFT